MQPAPASEAYLVALERERLGNARQIARFRFVTAAVMLGQNLFFEVIRPGYQGVPDLPLALYCLGSGVVLRWWKSGNAAARWSGRAIPLVDMPLVYLLFRPLVQSLTAGGFHDDAASTATLSTLIYLLLILAASLSLDQAFTWFSAGVALFFQSLLMRSQGRDPTFILVIAFLTAIGTWLSLYSRRRSLALVRNAALEQTRRERLGRYFSPQVAATLAERDEALGSGESREVTVLFVDLRGFTAIADQLDSRAVVALLNAFQARMVDCLFARGGTLDKYLGDGLMAYFGAPVAQEDHAERAVRCALEMQAAVAAMNRAPGAVPLRLGIGVHSGPVILGDIGASLRREYTAIGDTVNVAARLEQLTKEFGAEILVSDATRAQITAPFDFIPLEPVAVRGKSQMMKIYRIGTSDLRASSAAG